MFWNDFEDTAASVRGDASARVPLCVPRFIFCLVLSGRVAALVTRDEAKAGRELCVAVSRGLEGSHKRRNEQRHVIRKRNKKPGKKKKR